MLAKKRIELLQNERIYLTLQQIKLEDEKVKRTKEIEKIQKECNHEFKEYFTGYVECKKCGYFGA